MENDVQDFSVEKGKRQYLSKWSKASNSKYSYYTKNELKSYVSNTLEFYIKVFVALQMCATWEKINLQ